ncbi:MAG TPA: ABC transporter ATP-binding protein [Methanotrichaceae archaeon]|nr:ABC transporter ATP-binding protein [Methanotrichaceae archaeon]
MTIAEKPALVLKSIWKYYGGSAVLADISAEIGTGEIFILLGSNGSGKSTLLKIMAGLFPPDRGTMQIFGRVNGDDGPLSRKGRGVLFDHSPHWDALSGYENAWFFARSYGLSSDEAKDRLEDLFRWSGLWDKRDEPVSTYSYGMRRKLSLIQALAHRPRLLLLDEPSMGLDYSSRLAMYDLLKDECSRGTSIVIASNDIDEATSLATRVALMRQGRMIAAGKPSELMRSVDALTRIEVKLAAPIPLELIRGIWGVEGVEADLGGDGVSLRLLVSGDRSMGSVASDIISQVSEAGGSLLGMEVKEPNLGDLFLKLSEGDGSDDA